MQVRGWVGGRGKIPAQARIRDGLAARGLPQIAAAFPLWRMGHSYVRIRAHLLWATKYRRRWIDPEWRIALYVEMAAVAQRHDARIICAGGVSDHVHILMTWSPAVALSTVVRNIKTWSSHWVREGIPTRREFGWQNGFTAFTVHYRNLGGLIGYIIDQERHHGESSRVGGWIAPRFSRSVAESARFAGPGLQPGARDDAISD
jgi:putative transposase